MLTHACELDQNHLYEKVYRKMPHMEFRRACLKTIVSEILSSMSDIDGDNTFAFV